MAKSKIQISNLALAMLGEDSIRSFDESNKRARLCDTFYDSIRDYLLRKFDWPFARSMQRLQEVDSMLELPPGKKMFKLPADCQTPRDIYPPDKRITWEIVGENLMTNLENVYLYYTFKEVSSSRYSDTFIMSLATGMAVYMCLPVTQNEKMQRALRLQFAEQTMSDWSTDANIGNTYREPDNDPWKDTFNYPNAAFDPRLLDVDEAK